jgi:predicted nucleotidyltransferase component of viral defense system
MLDKQLHEINLRNILYKLYTNPKVSTQLAFKGGTCLYMFYNLDRFSTDLDFNSLTTHLDTDTISELLEEYGIKDIDFSEKRYTWFWLLNYKKELMNIKVEVSKRDYPDTYETKDFLGITVNCMTRDCMFAHKLCAITDRKKLVNRDLYDTLFMFQKNFPIKEEIIKIRTNKTLIEYLEFLLIFIEENVKEKNILDGLGEVLDEKTKMRVKTKLKSELLFIIKNYILTLK